MANEIIANRELIKAIGTETRVSILKSLASGRKTQTQLARGLNRSCPTVFEHLDHLVNAGLVNKIDEGRKWKYYELSRKVISFRINSVNGKASAEFDGMKIDAKSIAKVIESLGYKASEAI